jgi:hypothetical protein
MTIMRTVLVFLCLLILLPITAVAAERIRIIVETDAGGDPDDEQSLVRFLLYCNEWDVEGIIANRPKARDGENLNPKRTGLEIVRAQLKAYGQCYPNLILHDKRYPSLDYLWQRTVAGYDDTEDGVKLIVSAVDSADARPIWFCNWGTDAASGASSLKRALDQVLQQRGQAGYAKFKRRLRLSSADKFGDHTTSLDPPWPIWVDTFRPEQAGKRWYHRFSAITSTAGGFDVKRDVLMGHGPLGALYPTNTTHPQKEGDSMTFLYLVPTGMNDPEQPNWGSWAGRYGLNPAFPGRQYFWANQTDRWTGGTSRDNTLARWAAHLQNDFRAKLDWCVTDFAHANHAPIPKVRGSLIRSVHSGEEVSLDAGESTDPDGNARQFQWVRYPETGTYRGNDIVLDGSTSSKVSFVAPKVSEPKTVHIILLVTDDGSPPLTRYQRIVVTVEPGKAGQ